MICYGTNTKSDHSLMMNDALKLFLIKIITGQMLKAPWGVAISTMNFAGLDPELPRPYLPVLVRCSHPLQVWGHHSTSKCRETREASGPPQRSRDLQPGKMQKVLSAKNSQSSSTWKEAARGICSV